MTMSMSFVIKFVSLYNKNEIHNNFFQIFHFVYSKLDKWVNF